MNERSALFDLEPYKIIRNDMTNDVSRPDNGKIHVKFDQKENLFVLFFYDEEKKIINLKLKKIRNERELISLLVEKKHIFDRELFLEKFQNFLRQLPDEDITNVTKLYVQKLEELSELEIDDDIDFVQIEELSALRNKIIENLNNSGYGYQEKFTFDPSSIHGHEVLMERMHDLSLHILKLKEENENFETYFEALGFDKEIRSKIISYLTNTLNNKPNAKNNLAREILNESIESNFVPEEDCKDLESVIKELNFDEDFKKQIKSLCLKIETHRKELRKKSNLSSLARQPNVLSDLNRLISIVDLTNEIATGGNRLRLTQIVAILIFLNDKRGKGHISEISTGEGKTTIISCLAAIKVLQGHNVHVITSNNVLAEEAVKDREKFYQLLEISVSHNIDLNKSEKGSKTCYQSQVVYGSMANFQFDWLRHNAKQQRTMGSTDYAKTWVILDEIDSLIIDQGSHIARLSQQFPGMDYLRYVYINIWMRLEEKEREVYRNLCKQLEKKGQELKEAKINDDLKQKEFDDYKKNLTERAFDKIRQKLLIGKSSLIDTKIVPGYLLGYAQKILDNWIECAYKAKYFINENVEYKIIEQDGKQKIIPVDNQNTGVSMPDSIYSNLLHQFLQLKHNLKLTAESLNSCFISNIGYVKKYSNKLFGVTGTIGSENEQRFLKKIYDLNFSKIPTYKTKKFFLYPGRVFSEETFENKVALAALGEIVNNENHLARADLVICSSIKQVYSIENEIKKEAKRAKLKPKILKYRDEKDSHVTEQELKPGTILIATNISGRGTDLKTSTELERNGGLHVILAYMARNCRVQDQAMGRTARQGNQGTGQNLISLKEITDLVDSEEDDLKDYTSLIIYRDELESRRLESLEKDAVAVIEFNDLIFQEFIEYMKLFKREDDKKKDEKKDEKNDETEDNQLNFKEKLRNYYASLDMEERWAIWLKEKSFNSDFIATKLNDRDMKCLVKEQFDEFKSLTHTCFQDKLIQYNPYLSVLLAEKFAENGYFKLSKGELLNALSICKSDIIRSTASILEFEIEIELGEQFKRRYFKALKSIFELLPNSKNESDDDSDDEFNFHPNSITKMKPKIFANYKKNSIHHLKSAKESLNIEIEYLDNLFKNKLFVCILSPKIKEKYENHFLFDLEARYTCLNIYLGNVDKLIDQMEGEKKDEEGGEMVIGIKAKNYLKRLDSSSQDEKKIKKLIFDDNVDELSNISLNTIYELTKIYDVNEEVIKYAKTQILAGASLLALAAAVPVLVPVNVPLASIFISEGVTDIILALLNQGHSKFDRKAYIKSKITSYAISLIFLGITALLKSTWFLTKALNACRWLADKLRRVGGPFALVCNFVANQLEKLAKCIELAIKTIEFSKMCLQNQKLYLNSLKNSGKLREFNELAKIMKISDVVICAQQIIKGALISSTVGTVQSVAISVATDKIVSFSLDKILSGYKQKMEEYFIEKLEKKKDFYAKFSLETHNQVLEEMFDTSFSEDLEEILKNVSFGLLKTCQDWRAQLASFCIETICQIKDLIKCCKALCHKYDNFLHKKQKKKTPLANTEITLVIENVSKVFSDIIYAKLLAVSGSLVKTIPKIINSRMVQNSEREKDAKNLNKLVERNDQIKNSIEKTQDSNCVHTAASCILEVSIESLTDACSIAPSESGASIQDAKNIFSQLNVETEQTQSLEGAKQMMLESRSDRAEVFICYENGLNHTFVCFLIENELFIENCGEQQPLGSYLDKHSLAINQVEYLVPKNLNEQSLHDQILPFFYHKRIENSWNEIKYSGCDQDVLFKGAKLSKSELPKIMQNNKRDVYKFKDGNDQTNFGIDVDLRDSDKDFDQCIVETQDTIKKVIERLKQKDSKGNTLLNQREYEKVKETLVVNKDNKKINKIYDSLNTEGLHQVNEGELNKTRKIDRTTEIKIEIDKNTTLYLQVNLNLDIDPCDNGPCATHLGYELIVKRIKNDYTEKTINSSGHVFIPEGIIPKKYKK